MSSDPNAPSDHWDEVEAVQRYEREERKKQALQPQRGQDNANLIYILYLVNMAVPFLGIVGVIMAYSARDHAPADLRSHYENQIRIFWVTVIGYAIAIVTSIILIGLLIGLMVFIWKIVRVATGMSLLSRGVPVQNTQSFSFTSD